MVNYRSYLFSYILFIFMLTFSISCSATDENRKIHIVYMGSVPHGEYSLSSHHLSILEKVMDGSSVANSFIRSYKRSFNGFAANLNTIEAQKLAGMKEVISIFPSTNLQLHTTRSWDFMGFNKRVKRKLTGESDIIVGVIDSGIWPESESFSDQDFGPVPKKWKGACEGGKNFTCNKKIIGARYYSSIPTGHMSARDEEGHGSHTASIAAGNYVNDASFYGLAQGTARGGVPSARIAAYKVCHPDVGCNTADVLAAFDDAIADGVDLITISIGGDSGLNFDNDVIAIGAFHAIKKGILTIQSAGNAGVYPGRVASIAPWVLTVGASSTDRKFINKILLDNGTTLVGHSINSFKSDGTLFPLVYGRDVSQHCEEYQAQSCAEGCVDSNLVKGKIVLCNVFEGFNEAYKAGAMGAVVQSVRDDVSFVVPLPASAISSPDFFSLEGYINSTRNPRVNILKSEVVNDSTAPIVASFSSSGPNLLLPQILKPDVIAPGVNILAAFSPIASPTDGPFDKRQAKYNIMSGTSMSCPHVAGVVAYVKSFHPDWSPSAIKSAVMTTARPMNTTTNPMLLDFSYGSGLIDPVKAISPGLVFDSDEKDYIKLLCDMGFDSGSVGRITGDSSTCDSFNKSLPLDFNYPAISLQVAPMVSFAFKFRRTVTNVGFPNSTYTAKVIPSVNITVGVEPTVLSFKSLHEKKSFVVTVVGQGLPNIFSYPKIASATLVWFDGIHSVRIPIAVFSRNPDDF